MSSSRSSRSRIRGVTRGNRSATPAQQLDLASGLELAFEAPDLDAFPLLALAREAGERGGTFPCAYNAANEVAVEAFLEGRIGFLDIAGTVAHTLGEVDGLPVSDLGELEEADGTARRAAARAFAAA